MDSVVKRFLSASPVATIMGILMVIVLLTYVIPSGEFVREIDPSTGLAVVDGTSYHQIAKPFLSLMDIFTSIHQGFIEAADIIFLCFFSSFYIRVITDCGAFYAVVQSLIRKLGKNKQLMIPIVILAVSLAGVTYGELEDIYPLIPLFVTTSILLGYDAIVGVAISGGAVMIGFAASAFNPYTIGVAQNIAGLPLYSGWQLRLVIYLVFIAFYIFWVMRYASRIDAELNEDAAIYADQIKVLDESQDQILTGQHKVVIAGFLAVVAAMIYGAMQLGWYFKEISALFLMGALFSCVVLGYKPQQTVDTALAGFKDILLGVMVIGLARSILVMLNESLVLDTVIYGLYQVMLLLPKALFPIGILFIQTITNLFIPSGSGQAAAVMPIMIPLADLLEVNRQVSILAFQMGDGYSNLLWPTGAIAVVCGIGKVSLQRWYKFFMPFFMGIVVLECVFLIIANAIGYGPF
jgi:uncharacterized ion transporter superfamily protein YfcC